MNWENRRAREGAPAAGRSPDTESLPRTQAPRPTGIAPRRAAGAGLLRPAGQAAAGAQDVFWTALAWSLVAAVGYTAANVCLRSVTDQPPAWVSCVKAIPTLLMVFPWTLLRLVQGRGILSRWRDVGLLLVGSLLGQLAGNVLFQWSLGVIGLALAVPLTLGSLIVNGALLGHYVLRDRMTSSMLTAGAVLVFAIGVLSMGADSARQAVAATGPNGPLAGWHTLAGVAAACVSGFGYSCLGLAIRYTGRHGMPMPSTLLVASLTGSVALGTLTSMLYGPQAIRATPPEGWLLMLGAGAFNAVAFLAFTKALHTGSLFFVNAVNTTQIAMAAILGIVLFHEPPTVSLAVGLLLTMAGLLLMGRRSRQVS